LRREKEPNWCWDRRRRCEAGRIGTSFATDKSRWRTATVTDRVMPASVADGLDDRLETR
jgi:hypothetical protein